MAKKEPETSLRGRDARTGHFESVEDARKHPDTSVSPRGSLCRARAESKTQRDLSIVVFTIEAVGIVRSPQP